MSLSPRYQAAGGSAVRGVATQVMRSTSAMVWVFPGPVTSCVCVQGSLLEVGSEEVGQSAHCLPLGLNGFQMEHFRSRGVAGAEQG